MKSTPKYTPDKELVKVFEAAGVVDFLEYLQSGKRIMWVNFKAGIARGCGVTVGMTVVLGAFIWVSGTVVSGSSMLFRFPAVKLSWKEIQNLSRRQGVQIISELQLVDHVNKPPQASGFSLLGTSPGFRSTPFEVKVQQICCSHNSRI